MCSLFGLIDFKECLSTHTKNKILNTLARECQVRGTDATGIAYNFNDRLRIYKRPLPARKMKIHIPHGVNVVMGHTRMTLRVMHSLTRITTRFLVTLTAAVMPRVKVYDVGGVPVTVMEPEFVYGEYSCGLLWTDQFRAVDGVEILQALQVYAFDCVLAKTGNLGHLLERVGPKRQQVTGVLPKLHGYLVALRFERYRLHMGVPAATDKLYPVKTYRGEVAAEAQMTQHQLPVSVDMHPPAADRTDAIRFRQFQLTVEAKHLTVGNRPAYCRIGVIESLQPGWDA